MHMRSFIKMAASLIQYLVQCKTAKKCLINWKISAVNPPTLTFSEFYKEEAGAVVSNRRLNSMFVGRTKEDCTSEVDKNLCVAEVDHCFGQYIKFYVELPPDTQYTAVQSSSGWSLHCIHPRDL